MRLIDASNAEDYLRCCGHVQPEEFVAIRELTGGVSNVVLLVSSADGRPRFVLKQAREQLRVTEPWFCSPERIWREVAVLEVCHRALAKSAALTGDSDEPPVGVPRVLFTDRENYLFAMTAVGEHAVWKAQLLSGVVSPATAAGCGRLLGILHARTWQQPVVAEQLGDVAFFDALRLDPYYRHVGRTNPDLAAALQELEDSLARYPRCLVHGDFSPKNLLVHSGGLTLVDFEVGHYGDPAFDLGFFLTHLLLKARHLPEYRQTLVELTEVFWQRYQESLEPTSGGEEFTQLVARGICNLAGCLLARVAGKSPVEYLHRSDQEWVQGWGRDLLLRPPKTWPDVVARFESAQ